MPVSTIQLELIMDVTWDLTMQKIVPFIDGINSTKRIAELADADYTLTKKAISHLLYYGCLTLADIFSFAAIYAVTADISSILADSQMQDECVNYIRATDTQAVTFPHVFALYCSLSQGLTMKKWCQENYARLRGIDVRRFIGFGVVKGIVYRVQKYAVASEAERKQFKEPLARFLAGDSSFDEICTTMQAGEREVLKMLEGHDVLIVHR